jgi:para-nitrobenzyl esterase
MKTHIATGLLAICLAGSLSPAQAASPPVVTVSQGAGQGAVAGKLLDGVRRYMGMRFATAERWKAPQPAPAWSGTLDGTKFGASCPQKGSMLSADSKNEDCLFLNVYVPDDIGAAKLPVMVWVHGGGFSQGAASDYDVSILAKKTHTVIVSTNYRLGVFGFFALPGVRAETSNLNFGLQDQQAALRWVKANIAPFGGDASRVTIFGESAGGTAMCLHMVSPQSAGLFHRAISESGPCTVLTGSSLEVLAAASEKLASDFGCPSGPDQLACMRSKPVGDLNAATVLDLNLNSTAAHWSPVIDGVSIPDLPARMVSQGRYNRVPAIFGTNHDEGRLMVMANYHITKLLPVSAAQLAAELAGMAQGDASALAQLTATYTKAAYGSRDKALGAAITDSSFACHANNDAGALSPYSPAWAYEFNAPIYSAEINPYMTMGAFHGAEMGYVFQNKFPGLPIWVALNAKQKALADQMGGYWGNFAATGNPNGAGVPAWPAYKSTSPQVQNLALTGAAPIAAAAFQKDHQCAMWNAIWAARGEAP